MTECPTCRSRKFHVKDPDDAYETYEFECPDGEICFEDDVDPEQVPEITEKTETYCSRCTWHGEFGRLKK